MLKIKICFHYITASIKNSIESNLCVSYQIFLISNMNIGIQHAAQIFVVDRFLALPLQTHYSPTHYNSWYVEDFRLFISFFRNENTDEHRRFQYKSIGSLHWKLIPPTVLPAGSQQ